MPTYPFRHVRQRPHRSLGLGLVLCGPWCSGHCSLWSDCYARITVDISTTALLGVFLIPPFMPLSPSCTDHIYPRGWFVYSSGGIQCNPLPSRSALRLRHYVGQ